MVVTRETVRLDAIRADEGDYLVPMGVPKPVANISSFPVYKKRQ